MKRPFSILCHVVAGFLFFMAAFAGFISGLPFLGKILTMVVLLSLAGLVLVCGLVLTKFHNWAWDTGVVLLSAAALTGFLYFSMQDAAFRKMTKPGEFDGFGDCRTGFSFLLILMVVGFVLLHKKKADPQPESVV